MFEKRKQFCLSILLTTLFFWAWAGESWAMVSEVPPPKSGVKMPLFLTTQGGVGAGAPLDIAIETFLKGIRKHYPKITVRNIPGGSKDAIDRLISGTIQVGATAPQFLYEGWLGKGPFKEPDTTSFRLLYSIDVGFRANWVVKEDSKIFSVKDLDGKRFHCSSAGTTTAVYTIPAILAVHGLSYEKIRERGGFIYTGSFRSALDMLAAGQLDAAFSIEPAPSASLRHFTLTHKIRIIPYTEAEQKAAQTVTGWVPAVVTPQMYEWLDKDVASLSTLLSLGITTKLEKDVVYNLLSAVWSEYKNWKEIHPALGHIDPKANVIKIHEIPLHPGAEEFFKDFGFKIGPSQVEKLGKK